MMWSISASEAKPCTRWSRGVPSPMCSTLRSTVPALGFSLATKVKIKMAMIAHCVAGSAITGNDLCQDSVESLPWERTSTALLRELMHCFCRRARYVVHRAEDGESCPQGSLLPRMNEGDIQRLIEDRENARRNRDYDTGDRIRDELKNAGISLDDRDKRWSSRDGRSGETHMSCQSYVLPVPAD